MKLTKRFISVFLMAAMIIAALPGAAFAAVGDVTSNIVLTEGTQAGRSGVAVEWKMRTGSTKLSTANIAFTYDTTIFEPVDAAGNVVVLSEANPPKANDAQLVGCADFDFANDLYLKKGAGNLAYFAFIRSAFNKEPVFANETTIGKVFLAYKAGKSKQDVTAAAIRLATYPEADALAQSFVYAYADLTFTEYGYGSDNGATDTPGIADTITFAKDFEFAVPSQQFAAGFDAAISKTYGDANITDRTATLTEGTGAITYASSNTNVATVNATSGEVTIVGVGKTNITATAAAVGNTWGKTSVSYELTVAPRPITVTVDAVSRVYGAANPAFTAVVTAGSLAGGDTIDTLGLGLKTAATAQSDAGTYDVIGDGEYSPNYDVTIIGADKLTITKAPAKTLADKEVNCKYTATGEKTVNLAGLVEGATTYTAGTKTDTNNIIDSWSVGADGVLKYTITNTGEVGQSATLPVTIISKNYEDSTVNVIVTLTDKENQAALTVKGGNTVTYGKTITLSTEGGSGTGAVTYVVTPGTGNATIDGNGVLTPTQAGTVSVVATKAADNDYSEVQSDAFAVTINKATPAGTPAYTAIKETGKTLADAALTVGTITPTGTIAWDDAVTTEVTANKAYNWTFTPTDTNNYNTLTGKITLWSKGGGGGGGSAAVTTGKPSITSGDGGKVVADDKGNVTITPDAGYKVKDVTVNGKSVGAKTSLTGMTTKDKVVVTFEKDDTAVTPSGNFADVPAGHWAEKAVAYVYENGLFQGTSATAFEPNTAMNRGMLVTVLWRLDGKPAANAQAAFADVKSGDYYADAVAWANVNGIVKGYTASQFAPNDKVTREQMAAILYRYSEHKGYATTANADLSAFADSSKVSAYALDGVKWANNAGLMTGRTASTLAPQGDSTRAEVASMIQRFAQNVVK